MLPIQNRLKKDKDFKRVCRQGKPIFFENTALRYAKNNLSYTRIGILVSKKFFRKATQRNRAKRILRETMRQYLNRLKPGFDIVVFLRKNWEFGKESNCDKVKKQIGNILGKSNLFQ